MSIVRLSTIVSLNAFHTVDRSAYSVVHQQKRFRFKAKWAAGTVKKTPREWALDHFDIYHKAVFGPQWPSVRVALLSKSKYCALVNNFTSNRDDVITQLALHGAHDIVKLAASTEQPETDSVVVEASSAKLPADVDNQHLSSLSQRVSERLGTTDHSSSIHDFMPVKRVISEREKMILQNIEQNTKPVVDFELALAPSPPLCISNQLMAFAQDRGEMDDFAPAKRDPANKLGYYLMDAASILPVIALDLRPRCSVLDLCAAPGGKSLCILQTMLADTLTCVDNSLSRAERLKDVFHWYVPKSMLDERRVTIVRANGIDFYTRSDMRYDRVLVDVPCYSDRYVVTEDDSNMFKPSRLAERLELQDTQKGLLMSALLCCAPGGAVVYSTCTLSPAQNDGLIHAVVDTLHRNTDIKVAIEDTSAIARRFHRTFVFHKCRYGQLVLPNLTANFGPSYFCRLRKLQ